MNFVILNHLDRCFVQQSWIRRLRPVLLEITLGYAWVALVPSSVAGLAFLLMTLVQPMIGGVGIAAAMVAWFAGRMAGAQEAERPVCVFNGLLVGLYVAHVWIIGPEVLALALLSSIFAGWLTVVLGRLSWSLIGMPILSLPFAIVAILISASAKSLSVLRFNAYIAPPDLFGSQADKFLAAFGNLYFLPDPFTGLFLVVILLGFSRYAVLLAIAGYSTALLWLTLLGAAPEHLANTAWDSNAILAALLVGGLFATPSWLTAGLAVLAAVAASWLALALGRILDVAHLLPFSVPFVLSAWLILYAVVHNMRIANLFRIAAPDFPERSFERAQVSRSRAGKPGSVPLGLPFMGLWTVSQGFSGPHTHRGAWRHALDFIVLRGGSSFTNRGGRLEDFHCYNLPVLSPAYGQVWRIVNDVPDNAPGNINVAANWGNCVVIRLQDGKFVLLAHLRPQSITVQPGAWIKPGDVIGRCGNSGRSPQPHLHLHLQASDEPGATTLPFHLASVQLSRGDELPRYELSVVPEEGDALVAALEGDARPFYLLTGRGMRYTVACDESIQPDWSLHCAVDALGRLNLVSSTGARCVAESNWAVFSCVERSGPVDPFFDLWLLACGFTPASLQVQRWTDRFIPARLLPQAGARWLAWLVWPWASFAASEFVRRWDEEMQAWRQQGHHRQNLSGITVTTDALIAPQLGCTRMIAESGGHRYALQATSIFQKADIGIPAWESPLNALSIIGVPR